MITALPGARAAQRGGRHERRRVADDAPHRLAERGRRDVQRLHHQRAVGAQQQHARGVGVDQLGGGARNGGRGARPIPALGHGADDGVLRVQLAAGAALGRERRGQLLLEAQRVAGEHGALQRQRDRRRLAAHQVDLALAERAGLAAGQRQRADDGLAEPQRHDEQRPDAGLGDLGGDALQPLVARHVGDQHVRRARILPQQRGHGGALHGGDGGGRLGQHRPALLDHVDAGLRAGRERREMLADGGQGLLDRGAGRGLRGDLHERLHAAQLVVAAAGLAGPVQRLGRGGRELGGGGLGRDGRVTLAEVQLQRADDRRRRAAAAPTARRRAGRRPARRRRRSHRR